MLFSTPSKVYLKCLSLWEVVENDVDPATLPSNPTLIPRCDHCKKPGHEEKECWHKGKSQCFKCIRFWHLQKYCITKMEQANTVKEVGETLF